jgi:hypothetical protein
MSCLLLTVISATYVKTYIFLTDERFFIRQSSFTHYVIERQNAIKKVTVNAS